jgi:alanine racemase
VKALRHHLDLVGAVMCQPYTTWVELDRAALLHNVRVLKRLIAPAKFMAVVKGNAYGHGMVEIATTIAPYVDWFGVNSLDEAEGLRAANIGQPVLIMGATPPERLPGVVRGGFRQVVYDRAGAEALAAVAARLGAHAIVHLEVETGTNRLGARGAAAAELAAFIRAQSALVLEGIYTHYANVEDTLDNSYAEHQLHRYRATLTDVGACDGLLTHTAATAAGILYPQTRFGMVRVGIGLYGLWPSAQTAEAARRAGIALDLRPVLSWKARVVHLNDVPFGEPVGYGCTYVATRPRRIAVLPVGYYEGFDRGLSNRGRVLIRGQIAPVVGRVAMNMTMVDVTDIPGVAVGDEAVIIGRQGEVSLTAEDMAALLDTINYEVVTRINPALPRVWVNTHVADREA